MTKQLRELADRYLKKAAEDEVLLDAILSNREVSDDIFAFHAQQAIEKLLKAALTLLDVRVGKTHDLRLLMDELASNHHPIPEDISKIDAMTPYGTVGRYEDLPFAMPFSREELVGLVRCLKDWVERLPRS